MYLGLTAIATTLFFAQATRASTERLDAKVVILDSSGVDFKVIPGNRISRSQPRKICIELKNLGLEVRGVNQVVQHIKTPSKVTMRMPNAEIESSKDGTLHIIKFDIPRTRIVNGIYNHCGSVGSDEPLGVYKTDISFNGRSANGLIYEVID